MVVWLFAGGGESEIRALIPFLEKHFSPGIRFDRKTPVRKKPGAKPGKYLTASHGKTGRSLAREIKNRLAQSLSKESLCDLILVLDDLDCRDSDKATLSLQKPIFDCLGQHTPYCIGFASPEIEAWLISDWGNTFSVHPSFSGKRQKAMQYRLAQTDGVDFSKPESFGQYDPEKDSCDKKLSQCIVEASINISDKGDIVFSKARHTPEMLPGIDPENVCAKCPLFRSWWNRLKSILL
ncbi:DUF4276 family protein [Desulfonatronospira sp.]|uniref:DUF4276 family protein n=1 Tax=Desulfonatronospira sp. TaxID=1962951 RepID=UPI0025B7B292|nr:DUF4276 family protein [Desulfonatronospira sp.]